MFSSDVMGEDDLVIGDRGVTVQIDCDDCNATWEFTFPWSLVSIMASRGASQRFVHPQLGKCYLVNVREATEDCPKAPGYDLRFECPQCKSVRAPANQTKDWHTCYFVTDADALDWAADREHFVRSQSGRR